jgi:hypothetical protein
VVGAAATGAGGATGVAGPTERWLRVLLVLVPVPAVDAVLVLLSFDPRVFPRLTLESLTPLNTERSCSLL